MKINNVKSLGVNVSALGFGCMRFPLDKKGNVDEQQVQTMVDLAIENGVNYFDTAWVYHGGESEIVIGKALKKHKRESFFLADKLPVWQVEKPEDVDLIFEEQLKKCGVGYFDFYLLHSLNFARLEIIDKFDIYNRILKKKAEGKIRFLGFSMHDSDQFAKTITSKYKFDFAQMQLNYLDWTAMRGKELYQTLCDAGLPIVVMEPVRGGLLATLSDESAAILKAENQNASLASWALRYVASKNNLVTVLSGMSNIEQLQDNLKTFNNFKLLSIEEEKTIEKAKEVFLKNAHVMCTGCRYCMPCPFGVDIPACFAIYNASSYSKGGNNLNFHFSNLDKNSRPAKCQKCGICVKKCPQNIQIPKVLAEIDKLLN